MARADEPRVGAGRGRPHVCLPCKHKGQYYGRLVFENETEEPTCPNHKTPMPLIPA